MTVPTLIAVVIIGIAAWAITRSFRNGITRKARIKFIREYAFPAGLKFRLDQAYPDLSDEQIKHITEGLRAWFLIVAQSPNTHFGMPSKAIDTAWHEFILLTQNYADFCQKAFGKFLHHTPYVGDRKSEQEGLARTYGMGRQLIAGGVLAGVGGVAAASILSTHDMFGLDQQLGIPGGNAYSEGDLEILQARYQQMNATASSSGGDGGGFSGSPSCGDSGGSCGDGGGGGGCGGGGCGS